MRVTAFRRTLLNQTFGTSHSDGWCRSDAHSRCGRTPAVLAYSLRSQKATYAIAATPYLPTFAALTLLYALEAFP